MENLNIALVQTRLLWENKEGNMHMLAEKIENVKADIIVLPEMFTTGFTMNSNKLKEPTDSETLKWMRTLAQKTNAVITGSFIADVNARAYNRLLWVEPDGPYQHYDKRHLFRMAGEHEHYSPGNQKLITKLKGWKICPLICYDLRFPVWSRNKQELHQDNELMYDLLIYVANWPARRSYAWKQLLIARAIENQSYVAGVNRVGADENNIDYTGDSTLIGPDGTTVETAHPGQEQILNVTLQKETLVSYRNAFPAYKDSDHFTLI